MPELVLVFHLFVLEYQLGPGPGPGLLLLAH